MKACSLAALLIIGSVISSHGALIKSVTASSDTATDLSLSFLIEDNVLNPASFVTYTTEVFPAAGSTFTFGFDDRLFLRGNLESLTSSNGIAEFFVKNSGDLDFFGSYSGSNYSVNWAVDSVVTTRLGKESWSGTFTATAVYQGGAPPSSVPDGGTSVALLGSSLLGLSAFKRLKK